MTDLSPAGIKRFRETYKTEDFVLPAITRHVMRTPTWNVRPDDHDMSYMHPSDMVHKDWCGRHDWYRMEGYELEKTTGRSPSFQMENVLAEGHTIHDKYQRWLWEMGVLWGEWLCLECGHRYGAISPTVCQFCLSPRLVYREVTLRRKQILVEGHADGAVHDLDGWDGLIEIKSIGVGTLRFEAPRLHNLYQDGQSWEEIWWKITRPFPSHLKQGQLYLWMSFPRYEEICFIYESKASQKVKEFVVPYNKDLIAPILETAREVTQAIGTGVPPRRPDWADGPDSRVCKSCPYRGACYHLGAPRATQANDPAPATRVQRSTSAKRRGALRAAAIRPA